MSSGAEDMRRKSRSPPRRRKPDRLETIARSCVCSNRNGPKTVCPEAPATRMVDFIGPPGDGHLQQRLQLPKEVDYGGAYLRSTFLLGPMSATRQHHRWTELWNEYRLLGNGLLKHGDNEVAVARDVKRRNGDRRPIKGGQEFPAAIDVAPPAQGAAESAARECLDINIDVGLRDPRRQGRRIGQESALPRHHPGSKPSARGRRPVARERVELGTERATHVAPERRLGFGGLKEELVEHRILVPRHERRRRHRAAKRPRPERHAERDNSTETVGAQKRRLPCYRGADVVAGDHRLLGTQSVDETHDVADVMENRILLHLLRTVASPIAAQVWCHRTESSFRQRRELMPPGIPAFGKAVAEDDERAFTLLSHVQADAVRLDRAMRHLWHRRIHPGCRLRASPAGFGGSGLRQLRESSTDGERAHRPEHVASG